MDWSTCFASRVFATPIWVSTPAKRRTLTDGRKPPSKCPVIKSLPYFSSRVIILHFCLTCATTSHRLSYSKYQKTTYSLYAIIKDDQIKERTRDDRLTLWHSTNALLSNNTYVLHSNYPFEIDFLILRLCDLVKLSLRSNNVKRSVVYLTKCQLASSFRVLVGSAVDVCWWLDNITTGQLFLYWFFSTTIRPPSDVGRYLIDPFQDTSWFAREWITGLEETVTLVLQVAVCVGKD